MCLLFYQLCSLSPNPKEMINWKLQSFESLVNGHDVGANLEHAALLTKFKSLKESLVEEVGQHTVEGFAPRRAVADLRELVETHKISIPRQDHEG